MANALKVGLIGCGNICNQYFAGLKKFAITDLVACADLDFSRAEAKAAEHGVKPYTVEGLLADKEIDIVINLTIPAAHAPVNLAILEAGKHAYTEKPFCLSLEDGKAVIAKAAAKGLRTGCAPDTFLGGGIQTCRKLIDDGAIGTPVAAIANMYGHGPEGWHPDPEFFYQFGGGPMLDMGPYYLTALVNLLGPIGRVSGAVTAGLKERIVGSGKKQGTKIPVTVPTHYAGAYEFTEGAVASVNMSFDVWHHQLPIIEIYGTEGTLSVPDPNGFGGKVSVRRSDEKEWREVAHTHPVDVGRGIGVADMATGIRKNRPHRASGELALHVFEGMQAVEAAAKQGAYYRMTTPCDRPAALPADLPVGELD